MSTKLILSSIFSASFFKTSFGGDELFKTFRNSYPYPSVVESPLDEIIDKDLIDEYLEISNGYNDPDYPQCVYVSDPISHGLDRFDFSNSVTNIRDLQEKNNFHQANFNYEDIKSDLEKLNTNYENLKNSVLSKDTGVIRYLPFLVRSGNSHVPFLVRLNESSLNSDSPFLLTNLESIKYTYSSSFDHCSIIDTSLHMDFIGKGALVELLLEGIPDPIYLDPRVEGIYKTNLTKDLSPNTDYDAQHAINIIVKDYIIFSERKIIYSKFTSYTHETRNQ